MTGDLVIAVAGNCKLEMAGSALVPRSAHPPARLESSKSLPLPGAILKRCAVRLCSRGLVCFHRLQRSVSTWIRTVYTLHLWPGVSVQVLAVHQLPSPSNIYEVFGSGPVTATAQAFLPYFDDWLIISASGEQARSPRLCEPHSERQERQLYTQSASGLTLSEIQALPLAAGHADSTVLPMDTASDLLQIWINGFHIDTGLHKYKRVRVSNLCLRP